METSSRTRTLLKNTSIISIGKLSTQFVSFLLLPLFTSKLSTEDYGTVDLVATLVNLLLPVFFFQIDHALFRFMVDCRKESQDFKQDFSTAFAFAVLQSIVLFVLCAAVWPFVAIKAYYFLPLNLGITAFSTLMLSACRGIGNNKLYALASFLSSAVNVGLGFVLVGVLDYGLEGMLASIFAGNAVCALFVFWQLKLHRVFSVRNVSKEKLRAMLKYSLPLAPNAICWWAFTASNRLIVTAVLGIGSTGILSVAYKFTSIVSVLMTIFTLAWMESSALHIDDPDRDSFFRQVIGQGFASFSSLILMMLAALPFLFPMLINASYNAAYPLIPILMCASAFELIVALYSVVYQAVKNTVPVAIAAAAAAVINIGIHFALIQFIGLYAAAVSAVAAYCVIAIFRYFDVKKYVDAPLRAKSVLLFAGALLLTAAAYYSGNVWFHGIGLLMAVSYAAFSNKRLLLAVANMLKVRKGVGA